LLRKSEGIDIILHAAALKHVILCEQSPGEAVQTNILGTQNVIHAAHANRVRRVLFTSSDKAVNPTNVMGTSKLMCERLMTAANAYQRNGGPIFASTRFGNVLGSRGSVIPLFRRQIASGGPVTLTDMRMTRFIMTLQQAVRLVMESVHLACGGEVIVTKMPVVRIPDLASVMVNELAPCWGHKPEDIRILALGARPGEKLYEELLSEEETRRTLELNNYYVARPAFTSVYQNIEYSYPGVVNPNVERPYNSSVATPLSVEELRDYLRLNRLLEESDEP
jgi:FlaA1/EpsC-like NDP-sugar epimerase